MSSSPEESNFRWRIFPKIYQTSSINVNRTLCMSWLTFKCDCCECRFKVKLKPCSDIDYADVMRSEWKRGGCTAEADITQTTEGLIVMHNNTAVCAKVWVSLVKFKNVMLHQTYQSISVLVWMADKCVRQYCTVILHLLPQPTLMVLFSNTLETQNETTQEITKMIMEGNDK